MEKEKLRAQLLQLLRDTNGWGAAAAEAYLLKCTDADRELLTAVVAEGDVVPIGERIIQAVNEIADRRRVAEVLPKFLSPDDFAALAAAGEAGDLNQVGGTLDDIAKKLVLAAAAQPRA